MGGWNPIADIGKAVENVTKEVTKGVENVVRETGNVVQTTGQIVGNVGTLVGGDVGKVINAATAPFGATIQAGGDLIKGDIKGSVARQTGAFLAAGTAPIAASTTVRDIAKNDYVNNFFGGMTNDLAEVHDASVRMIRDGDITQQDWSAMGRTAGRGAIIVGGAAGLVAAGPGAGAAITSGAGAAGSAASAVGGTVATSVIRNEITRALAGGNDTPKAEAVTQASASSAGAMPFVLAGGLGLLALILILKRR